jgi:hypothetical protein
VDVGLIETALDLLREPTIGCAAGTLEAGLELGLTQPLGEADQARHEIILLQPAPGELLDPKRAFATADGTLREPRPGTICG